MKESSIAFILIAIFLAAAAVFVIIVMPNTVKGIRDQGVGDQLPRIILEPGWDIRLVSFNMLGER